MNNYAELCSPHSLTATLAQTGHAGDGSQSLARTLNMRLLLRASFNFCHDSLAEANS